MNHTRGASTNFYSVERIFKDIRKCKKNLDEIENIVCNIGFNINIEDKKGRTISSFLASQNIFTAKLVQMIIYQGGDLFRPMSKTNKELIAVEIIRSRDMQAINAMIDHMSDKALKLDKYGNNVLHLVVKLGNANIVLGILGMVGEILNIPNSEQDTPLHLATYFEHLEIVEILLKHGADVNAVGKHGRTPLHLAAGMKTKAEKNYMMELLVRYRANVNIKDSAGCTPFLSLCQSHDPNEILYWLLLEAGADVNLADNYGITPLHIIPFPSNLGCSLLLDYGANKNARTKCGLSPLQICIQTGNIINMQILLEENVDISGFLLASPSLSDFSRSRCSEILVAYMLLKKSESSSWEIKEDAEYLQEILKRSIWKDYVGKVEREIEKMKVSKVGDFERSLWDIAIADSRKIVQYFSNDELMHQMAVLEDFSKFPVFGEGLRRKSFRACRRRILLDECLYRLPTVLRSQLPQLCLEEILNNLNQHSYRKIIETYGLIVGECENPVGPLVYNLKLGADLLPPKISIEDLGDGSEKMKLIHNCLNGSWLSDNLNTKD